MADFFRAENTLNKLFAAQRNHPHAEPIPSETLVQAPQPLTSKPQKSTLHSFWKQLPAPQAQPHRLLAANACPASGSWPPMRRL